MTAFASFDLAAFETSKGKDRRAKAHEIDAICQTTGFLVLDNHGVPDQITANIWAAVQSFFAQTPAEKRKTAAPYAGYPYGYLGPNSEALAKSKGQDTPPDLKESFNGGPLTTPPQTSPTPMR